MPRERERDGNLQIVDLIDIVVALEARGAVKLADGVCCSQGDGEYAIRESGEGVGLMLHGRARINSPPQHKGSVTGERETK